MQSVLLSTQSQLVCCDLRRDRVGVKDMAGTDLLLNRGLHEELSWLVEAELAPLEARKLPLVIPQISCRGSSHLVQ